MYRSPQIVKHIPSTTSNLVRKLSLIQLMYKKYRKIKDQITNKQIQYMLANDGILSGDLQPNTEAYLREYTKILDQSSQAQNLLIQNQLSIDQCLLIIENMLMKLAKEDLQSVSELSYSYEQPENRKGGIQHYKQDKNSDYQQEKPAFYSSGTNFQSSDSKSETKTMTKYKRQHKFNQQAEQEVKYDKSISKYKSKSKSKYKDSEQYKYNQESEKKLKYKLNSKANVQEKKKSRKVKQERKTQKKNRKTMNKQEKSQEQIYEEQQEIMKFQKQFFFEDELYTQKKLIIGANSQVSSQASLN